MNNDNNNLPPTTMTKFDRAISALKGMPDVIETPATPVRTIKTLVGGSQTFIIQTFRRLRDRQADPADDYGARAVAKADIAGDTLFIEYVDGELATRLVLPPEVTRVIARQRDALTARTRKRAAKAGYETRRRNGTQVTPPRRSASKRKAVK